MRILIVGVGAIGTWLGGLLSLENKVWVSGRKEQVEAINKKGVIVDSKPISKPIGIVNINDLKIKPELIIIAVKSYDTEEAINEVKGCIGSNTLVLSFQNGLGNEEIIGEVIGVSKVIGGVTAHGITYEGPGKVAHKGSGHTYIGKIDGEITQKVIRIAKILNEAGIETKITNQIQKEKWLKAIVNAGINPLTAINECKNGELLDKGKLEKRLEAICKECTRAALAAGIKFDQDPIIVTKEIAKKTSENYSSMFQSIKAKKQTEIDFINGYFLKLGKKLGIRMPINEAIVKKVKTMERQFSSNFSASNKTNSV
jgi:2-dehydropantoate 2-reductase